MLYPWALGCHLDGQYTPTRNTAQSPKLPPRCAVERRGNVAGHRQGRSAFARRAWLSDGQRQIGGEWGILVWGFFSRGLSRVYDGSCRGGYARRQYRNSDEQADGLGYEAAGHSHLLSPWRGEPGGSLIEHLRKPLVALLYLDNVRVRVFPPFDQADYWLAEVAAQGASASFGLVAWGFSPRPLS